jgi:hypothetical protein|tara:strand:+ start:148 stop:279 length:132 start_codon:yes stop_codon:yes gene_type:complete
MFSYAWITSEDNPDSEEIEEEEEENGNETSSRVTAFDNAMVLM